MRSHIAITGVQQHLRAIGKAKTQDAIRIEDGLIKCAGVILRKSLKYCPIEFGPLRASGRIEAEGKGFGCKVRVVFGGTADVHYALYVHEDMTKYHEPPTQAKWLERGSRETRGTCASILKRTLVSGTYRLYDEDVSKIEPPE